MFAPTLAPTFLPTLAATTIFLDAFFLLLGICWLSARRASFLMRVRMLGSLTKRRSILRASRSTRLI